jgi:hypothetical protein
MPAEQAIPRPIRLHLCAGAATLCLLFSAAVCGCGLHLDDSTLALEAATAPVVDHAADAYRDANELHNLRVDYDAVAAFDAESVYNPRNLEVLLSNKDIGIRLAVLEGFQLYVKSLCAMVSGTNPKELGTASVSLGGQLTSLANTLAPSIEKAAGIGKSDGSTTTTVISPETQNAITTGLDALGKFLITRKLKAELPSKISAMDPHVQALAALLESDIDVLKDQEHRDYDRIINLQTLSIRKNDKLPFDERRTEIMKLPDIVRKERAAEEKLTALRAAVVTLAETHKQLVADAQAKNPESLKEKLQDLANAATELGTFYSSLSQ